MDGIGGAPAPCLECQQPVETPWWANHYPDGTYISRRCPKCLHVQVEGPFQSLEAIRKFVHTAPAVT